MSSEFPADPGTQASGLLFIVSAPSGAGKTTLVERVVDETPRLRMSRSYTSRPARQGEIDGVDYNFVTRSRFETMVAAGELAVVVVAALALAWELYGGQPRARELGPLAWPVASPAIDARTSETIPQVARCRNEISRCVPLNASSSVISTS